MDKPVVVRLTIRDGVHGRGVFTQDAIARGQFLLRFSGPLLRYHQTSPQTLALQIGRDLYLGGSGEADDCVNHSCDPNAGLVIESGNVELVAIRDIAAGEEIVFDYSTTMDEDDFEMACRCGQATCRGTVRDFKHLAVELRRRYVMLGIVPAYNRKYAGVERGESPAGGGDQTLNICN